MSVLITGGTGFVGRHLVHQLAQQGPLILTSRNPQRAQQRQGGSSPQLIQWARPTEQPPALPRNSQIRAVVNLMGDSIADGRWTPEKKKLIRDSRVLGTAQLLEAISDLPQKPDVLVCASAVGFYGDPGESEVTETSPFGTGFLPEVCQQWEDAADQAAELSIRVVKLRIGIVLGKHGGALEKMVPLFRWGLGGKLGAGQQWMPWIHVDDLVNMIQWAIETPTVSGAYNATAPNPVRNSTFTQELANSLGRYALLPAPKFGVKLVLGEFADSLFFSQRVIPQKALDEGFEFQFPNLTQALQNLHGH